MTWWTILCTRCALRIITADMSVNPASCHSKIAPPPPSLPFSPPNLRPQIAHLLPFLVNGLPREADTNMRKGSSFDHDDLFMIMIFFMKDHLYCRSLISSAFPLNTMLKSSLLCPLSDHCPEQNQGANAALSRPPRERRSRHQEDQKGILRPSCGALPRSARAPS